MLLEAQLTLNSLCKMNAPSDNSSESGHRPEAGSPNVRDGADGADSATDDDDLADLALTAVATGRPVPEDSKPSAETPEEEPITAKRTFKAIDTDATYHQPNKFQVGPSHEARLMDSLGTNAATAGRDGGTTLNSGFGGSAGDYAQLSRDTIAALQMQGYVANVPNQSPFQLAGGGMNAMQSNGLMGFGDPAAVNMPNLSALQMLREQNIRNQQAAILLAQMGSRQYDTLVSGAPWDGQLRAAMNRQAALNPFGNHPLDPLSIQQSLGFNTDALGQNHLLNNTQPDLASMIRQAQGNNSNMAAMSAFSQVAPQQTSVASIPPRQPPAPSGPVELPPSFEGPLASWCSRKFFPLGIDEDQNWLSEFHCFVRSEFVELFRASKEDVKMRNSSITYMQVGMRCRYCAHLTPAGRAGRSSAFPSSLRQIYQSFTMMLRDHFGGCDAIPPQLLDRFVELKDKPSQGATDSKRYWIYSAMKVGMVDSKEGIKINATSRTNGEAAAPFGTNPNKQWDDESTASIPLVLPSDRPLISEFLYLIMTQVQPIRLMESECIGNRRSLRVGLPGFGCRYCCERRRLGLCRMFPARRRTLPGKISDSYDHLRRCALCPANVKEQLERLKHQLNEGYQADQGSDRDFFDRVWSRLGHENQSA